MKISINQRYIPFARYIADAFTNLWATKLRTFLAMLGILVGSASVVALLSGGELLTQQALQQFKALGTNLLALEISDTTSARQPLSLKMLLPLRAADPSIQAIAPHTLLFLPIASGGRKIHANILGATNTLNTVMKLKLSNGRFISPLDKYNDFCVVGANIYQHIQKETHKSPLGQQLNIHGTYFTIVGAIKPILQNAFLFANLNQSILVSLPRSLLMSQQSRIGSIIFTLMPGANIDKTEQHIRHYFQHVAPTKRLFFQSAKKIVAQLKKQQAILTLFLGFIGAISLFVGGIGVMNIMLISVTERRREIGIRMAIGATQRDIQRLFIIEAIMLSVLGGLLGIALGELIALGIAWAKGWAFSLFFYPALIGFSVSAIAGIFFGFYPAYRASKLNPIDTLHSE
jgi:putative ABC transport system permease protein